jgi:CheY-like chemotaxis protein
MAENLLFVLLADDDDDDDRLFFNTALDELKLETKVEYVQDGEQLMKYLAQTDAKLPDILFLDLNMPKKTGYECLVEIKKDKNLKDIVVVIYSTSLALEDIEYTFDQGANFYIQKPNDYKSLKKIINATLLRSCQDHAAAVKRENFVIRLSNLT